MQHQSTPLQPPSLPLQHPHQPSTPNQLDESKIYKKEKQILVEFESKSRDLKQQLNEGIKCIEQRQDTQTSILYELQEFFKKRAECEAQYARDLDKLTKQIQARHKSEKSKRESWHLHSAYKLWESLINDTKQHSKYHHIFSEICSKYISEKFDEIIDDTKRILNKYKLVSHSIHDEIFKVVAELNASMKTYHEYQSESKQAEDKLKYVQSQKPKFDKEKSKKKVKQYEKQVEKRLQKYTETKVKAFKARNEYILSIDSANACINKYCNEDIADLIVSMNFSFHSSLARCVYMYISGNENIKRSRQQTVDYLNRCIGDLDHSSDIKKYLDSYSYVFQIPIKFTYEPHKGDEIAQVNAQSLIRSEMEKRNEQLGQRLEALKAENNEIYKTIEATEHSILKFIDSIKYDVSDLFRDLNLTDSHTNHQTKEKRIETEDFYVEKVRQYTINSNLVARLEARHTMMDKALQGALSSSDSKSSPSFSNTNKSFGLNDSKKKIGKSPIIGQPRVFGGKLIDYMNSTKQDIPTIMTSCIKAINRLGLHNQGIFRIPGSQLEINQFKDAFEKGEDPLVNVTPREINSVAGVLKLYLRELKDPVFTRDMYDQFINTMRITSNSSNSTTTSIIVENLETQKVDNIRRVIEQLPKQVFTVLRYLFSFLNHLSEFKDENMMDAYNIAICLAPTLIPVPEDKKDQVNHQTDTIEFVKLIIQNCDEIFSMECDGPLYEKFDSEIDHEEENLDDLDVDEDDPIEDADSRQCLKNLSDDELYVTEAIALYDYTGRSDKEISFRKGDLLAIRGQLSADWWHGSLKTSNDSQVFKLGYIPDKYVALRSSKRKFSSSLMSTPQTATNTPLTTKTPVQNLKLKQHGFKDSNSLNMLNLDKSNLSELLKVKESDILDDDDSDSANFKQLTKPSYFGSSQSKFNSSTNSLYHTDSFSFKNSTSSPLVLNKQHLQQQNQNQQTNKSKMNQIEDALASVLDDMKQLDFSTSLSTTPSSNNLQTKSFNPLFSSNLVSTSTTSSPTSKTFNQSPFSGKNFNLMTQSTSSGINNQANNKRPDLVLDLPLQETNTIVKNLQDLTINMTNQFISTLPTKVRRKSIDRTNKIDSLRSIDTNKPKLNLFQLNSDLQSKNTNIDTPSKSSVMIKEQLHSSSSSSTGSSSVTSSLSDHNPNELIKSTQVSNSNNSLTTGAIITSGVSSSINDNLKMSQSLIDADNVESNNLIKTLSSSSRDDLDDLEVKSKKEESVLKVSTFKQPPPVMKKPSMSEEIIRKLGRTVSVEQQHQNQHQSSLISESISTSTLSVDNNNANESNLNNSTTKPTNNLSIRLSNSKATDV